MNLKPIILLSEYQLLRELVKHNPKEGKSLSDELNRAIVIKEEELNKKSFVSVRKSNSWL